MVLLCSSRWSDQKCCKTECVALNQAFKQDECELLKPNFLQDTDFKVRVKVSYVYETLKINDFSRQNHGHGGHEHGVRRVSLGVSFHLRRCPQGGRHYYFARKPPFLGPDNQR